MAAVLGSSTPELRPWVSTMVRLGYAAKGLIYLLIGTLAIQLAFGLDGGRVTDASGALRVVLRQPFGLILIGVIAVGILTYSGWQILEGLLDTRHRGSSARGWIERTLTIIKGAVYGAVGWEALQLVLGLRGGSQSADDYARSVMRVPFGNWFFALVGLGVGIYGVRQIWKAWRGQFDDDVDAQRMRREVGGWTLAVGRAGTAGRGIILAVMGLLLARAGFDRRPSQAGGMTDSLWTLMVQPYGAWLLAAAAAGLVCFGIFQLLHWRYARLAPLHR
jgi:hypothetical protein